VKDPPLDKTENMTLPVGGVVSVGSTPATVAMQLEGSFRFKTAGVHETKVVVVAEITVRKIRGLINEG